jgi:hypothetical protein
MRIVEACGRVRPDLQRVEHVTTAVVGTLGQGASELSADAVPHRDDAGQHEQADDPEHYEHDHELTSLCWHEASLRVLRSNRAVVVRVQSGGADGGNVAGVLGESLERLLTVVTMVVA